MLTKLMTNSRASETGSASKLILNAYRGSPINSDTYLQNIMNLLEKQTDELIKALYRTKAKSTLKEMNAARDGLWRSLAYLLLGAVHHPDPGIKAAGEKLYHVFEKYGMALTRNSYAIQTSLIKSFLDDLSEPDMQEPIAAVSGCSERLAALESAQDEFENSRLKWQTAQGKESKLVNSTYVKQQTVHLINMKLVDYLRAMQQVDDATYGAFTQTVATIIADTNHLVKRRSKKKVS